MKMQQCVNRALPVFLVLTLLLSGCGPIVVEKNESRVEEGVTAPSPSPTANPPASPTTAAGPTATAGEPTQPPAPPTELSIPAASLTPAASWQPIPDLPRHVNALLADPRDPQVLYAGTGSTGSGSGVYKSADGGLTWVRASSGLPAEDVRALAMSQTDPPTLYAAVGQRGDVYASADGAQSWIRLGAYEWTGFRARLAAAPGGNTLFVVEDVRGVYRSLDGGANWLELGQGLPKDENDNVQSQALALDPSDPNVVYLGTGWSAFGGNGIYKSSDGGDTWTPANRGLIDYSITALALNPVDPQIVYAGAHGGEFFRSPDGGENWQELSERLPQTKYSQPSVAEIALDPAAPDTVYLLCQRLGVLASRDGGESWRSLGQPSELDNAEFTAMAFVVGSEPTLVVGTAGGGGWRYGPSQTAQAPTPTPPPAESLTAAPTLAPARWKPLPDLPRQVNALALDPRAPQVLYAGAGSSGAGSGVYRSVDGGLTWVRASDGLPAEDVRALATSRADPASLYAAVGHRGDVYASADGAQSWSRVGAYEWTGFEAQLLVSPGDGDALFVAEGVRGAFRSLDGGGNWTPLTQGLPVDEHDNVSVQALALDPVDPNVVYLGTGSGPFGGNGVFKSTDGGETWTPANRGLVDYSITALALDPADPQIVYAGAHGGELFKSSDGGGSWRDLSPQLPEQTGVVAVAVDPAGRVYLLCDRLGVLVSYDGGGSWRLVGKPGGLDYPTFSALLVVPGARPVLVVGVGDEGAWRYASD